MVRSPTFASTGGPEEQPASSAARTARMGTRASRRTGMARESHGVPLDGSWGSGRPPVYRSRAAGATGGGRAVRRPGAGRDPYRAGPAGPGPAARAPFDMPPDGAETRAWRHSWAVVASPGRHSQPDGGNMLRALQVFLLSCGLVSLASAGPLTVGLRAGSSIPDLRDNGGNDLRGLVVPRGALLRGLRGAGDHARLLGAGGGGLLGARRQEGRPAAHHHGPVGARRAAGHDALCAVQEHRQARLSRDPGAGEVSLRSGEPPVRGRRSPTSDSCSRPRP